MTQGIGTIQTRERQRDKFPIVFMNNTSEKIPPHAIMEIESVSGVPVGRGQLVLVKKPTSDATANNCIVNGPLSVRADKKGRGRIASPLVIRFTGTEPELGDTVGPLDGEWSVSTDGSGYAVLGGAEDSVVLCSSLGGGTNFKAGLYKVDAEETVDPRADGVPGYISPANCDIIFGDALIADFENWSTVELTGDTYLVVIEIQERSLIVSAFC